MKSFGLSIFSCGVVCALLLFGYITLHSQNAQAAINPEINFQGKLTNTDGTNVTNGTYSIVFSLYSVASGGSAIWSETQSSVSVNDGIFRVSLGSITSLPGSVNFNSNSIYLGIKVGADPEMSPRVKFTAAPYAFNSDTLDGLDSADFGQLTASNSWTGINTFAGNTSLGSVGTATASTTIHIADTTNATGTQLVTIGSTAKSTNVTTIQGGGAASTIVLQTAASGGIDIGVNNVANKTINIGSVGATAQTTTVHIADSSGAAQTLTLGSANTTSTTTIQGGSGNINLSPSAGNDVVFSQGAGSNLQLNASAATIVDQVSITNASGATSTTGVDGLALNFSTTGSTASADNAGLRIDVTSNNSGATTTLAGVKVGDLTSPEANSTETGLYVGANWDIGLDLESGGINLAAFTSGGSPSDPTTPPADNLRVYAKKVSGRMLLKFIGPSGVDSPFQPALFGNNVIMYTPTSGTTVTGGFGTLWAKGSGAGTVSTPTPSSTAPAISNQIHRTRHQNAATTTNQVIGIQYSGADGAQFWRGNAAGLGGFFFNTRFTLDSYPAATIRIFAGLASSTTGVVASNTVAGDVAGLWHDTGDSATTMNFVTRNNATTTKTPIALSNALAAGNMYDFYMFCPPNGTTIYYRLDDVVNGVIYEGSTGTTLPRNTIFMGPQVEVSNGTANTTVGTTAIGVNRIYIESDY